MTTVLDDFLAHYGVKGMKWGKRQARDQAADAHGANFQKHQSELKKLTSAGRGNDIVAVTKAAQKYESTRKQINSDLKTKLKTDSGMSRSEKKIMDRKIKDEQDIAILAARARQQKRTGDLNAKAAATYMQKTQKGQIAAEQAYAKAESRLVTNPDAYTSQRMTSGERAATNVALTLGAVGFAGMLAASALLKD